MWREREDYPGSGVLFDLGPHLIDQALVLFGEPQSITAKAFRQREGSQVDDSFDVCLQYPRLRADAAGQNHRLRSRSTFSSSRNQGIVSEICDGPAGGTAAVGKDSGQERVGKDWGQETEPEWGTLTLVSEPRGAKIKSEAGDYRGFYANVRDAIEKKERQSR